MNLFASGLLIKLFKYPGYFKSNYFTIKLSRSKRLARILPNTQVVTLPHSGHACLVEEGVNLYEIMQSENFLDSMYGN